ncbi:dihydroxyacetone kinase family protein [Glycomyces xiaoerkulensis]|uniref:dihydroxyacetone kinase family protein n=1 Tax=Glycomyces xiaoerkulensis TaxID=2038139 RepID=UPI000C26BFFF|nr:dihydroxyacetone kinase family protein [Glycomyces xiaoerkulensis]
MTYLLNDPARFADELIEGFVAAHPSWVQAVPGGVVRATRVPDGEVAVVIGGGSGHYPAFAGLVGPGLAHGAAMGNVFASPSAEQVYTVARAASAGGGILFAYGNYAGDVLNFDLAQERLRAEGIDCRTVVVTDDVSSAPPEQRDERRGIVGDLVVFKAAGQAAEAGLPLDEVRDLADRANERTRSFGVAFSGCTLPGADGPLFTVPEGRMGVGMGIHGEPGIGEEEVPSADDLAERLVRTLLAEAPADAGDRVAPVLNGLGAVKYEELFVLYRRVARLLAEAGLEAVEPDVGEFCTSFQMAGLSLTLTWLDEDLERAWRGPADTPGYRKGPMPARERRGTAEIAAAIELQIPDSDEDSRAAAKAAATALAAAAAVIDDGAVELGRLDAVAGDGDHGIGMRRGATAAAERARKAVALGAGAATTLRLAGDAWAHRAGGTSGALWGLILQSLGGELADSGRPGPAQVVAGVREAETQVARYGGARRGDKTLLDALGPFADALESAVAGGDRIAVAWPRAAVAAEAGARATADLLPRKGRARPHAENSLGTPDPGAVSLASVARAVGEVLTDDPKGEHDE